MLSDKVNPHNTSGVTGVSWRRYRNRWQAYINVNCKQIHLGYFADKDDAIKARLDAEAIYFKERAPQRHLFEQYKIKA